MDYPRQCGSAKFRKSRLAGYKTHRQQNYRHQKQICDADGMKQQFTQPLHYWQAP
jgi:hypothetical protein